MPEDRSAWPVAGLGTAALSQQPSIREGFPGLPRPAPASWRSCCSHSCAGLTTHRTWSMSCHGHRRLLLKWKLNLSPADSQEPRLKGLPLQTPCLFLTRKAHPTGGLTPKRGRCQLGTGSSFPCRLSLWRQCRMGCAEGKVSMWSNHHEAQSPQRNMLRAPSMSWDHLSTCISDPCSHAVQKTGEKLKI